MKFMFCFYQCRVFSDILNSCVYCISASCMYLFLDVLVIRYATVKSIKNCDEVRKYNHCGRPCKMFILH
jgi:hypothetical protein